MKPLLFTLLLCAATTLPAQTAAPETTLPADGPKLTPEQTASIIKQLDELEAKIGKNRNDILGAALTKFRQALAAGEKGALDLYLECYKLEHFDRENLKVTDFQDWKKRNEDKHKDPEFLRALFLQLEYLALSIQVQDMKEKDIPTVVATLQGFIPKVVVAIQSATKHTASGAVMENDKGGVKTPRGPGGRPGGGGGRGFDSGGLQGMLRQSVKQSEFAKAYLLDEHLKKADWVYDPLEIVGIYRDQIFPYYLETKPAELPAQWDARIKAELTIRAAVMSETDYALYYKENYPVMLWNKAEYLVSHNINTILSMAEMLKLIRENPMHPSAGGWAKQLRTLVNAAQPSLLPSGSANLPPAPTSTP